MYVCVCVWVWVWVGVGVCVRECVWVRVCVRVRVCVSAKIWCLVFGVTSDDKMKFYYEKMIVFWGGFTSNRHQGGGKL